MGLVSRMAIGAILSSLFIGVSGGSAVATSETIIPRSLTTSEFGTQITETTEAWIAGAVSRRSSTWVEDSAQSTDTFRYTPKRVVWRSVSKTSDKVSFTVKCPLSSRGSVLLRSCKVKPRALQGFVSVPPSFSKLLKDRLRPSLFACLAQESVGSYNVTGSGREKVFTITSTAGVVSVARFNSSSVSCNTDTGVFGFTATVR